MSRCTCSSPREFRVTGEVWRYPDVERAVGSGSKAVRVRCGECGGKVGRIGSDVLTDLFGVPETDIESGRCLSETEQRTVTVDLI